MIMGHVVDRVGCPAQRKHSISVIPLPFKSRSSTFNFFYFFQLNPTSLTHTAMTAASVEQLEKLVGQEYAVEPVGPF
jgi:hypothetical protein